MQDYVKFWPDEGDFKEYKNFGMTLISESHQSGHVVRDFLLQSTQVNDVGGRLRVDARLY